MRIIVVANQKGGCGKTTVVINLAACLAREGQRTLAVDMDPQGHCALGLAVPEEQIEASIADVLLSADGKSQPDLSRVTWQISSNFDLIPARFDLSTLEQRLAGVPGRERRLRQCLDTIEDKYDVVLVDSPPTVGFLTQSALYAADEVVIPMDTGYFSLQGLAKQLETVRAMRAAWGKTFVVRILANLYDVRTKLGREILAELRKRHGDALYTSFVNFNTKLKESSSLGQPITEYDPASSGCRDFVRLAREIISLGRPRTASAPVTALGTGTEENLLKRADALAADANRLLATTETLLGSGRLASVPRAAPTPEETERRIEMLYGPQCLKDGTIFIVRADGARTVRLAGDFNNWNPDRTPMRSVRKNTFQVQLPLPPGRYQYRYVIDGQWRNDPANEKVMPNPFGELNSVVEVG
ncbi:MAG TPA: AAA family ATPase [Phycisphaerae bacterium]|nr:AAA family ATPase [Phycisphaerae bacterium]